MTLIYPVYALAGAVASLTVIESGAYITEQYRFGFNIGASGILALYAACFLTVAHIWISYWADRMSGRVSRRATRVLGLYVVGTSVGSVLFYGVVFLRYGTALSDLTRFAWLASLPNVLIDAHTLIRSYIIPVAFALAGILLVVNGWRRSWYVIFLALPLVCLFWAGDKFSGFALPLILGCVGVGVGCIYAGVRPRIRLRQFGWIGVLGLLLLGIVAFGYIRSGAQNAVSAIADRLALQGHVWFGIFDRLGGAPGVDFFTMVRDNTLSTPSGLDALSYLVSDPNFVHERLGRGVTFTMGGPATALAALGTWGGLIAFSATAFLYVAVIYGIVRLGYSQMYVPVLVLLCLYLVVGAATQMGYWDALYSPVALGCYSLLIICLLAAVGMRRLKSQHEARISMPLD